MKNQIFKHILIAFFTAISFVSQALDQDIDIAAVSPQFSITAIVGQPLNLQIGVLNAGANVFWTDFTLNGIFPLVCPGGGAELDNCNGISVALPVTSTTTAVSNLLKVVISGTPLAVGTITFTLNVTVDGGASQSRQYSIEIRRPLDIAFVLDRSGSMSLTTDGTVRWEGLKSAVNGFMLKMSAPEFATANDRVGLNFFHTTVTQSPSVVNMIPLATAGASVTAALAAEAPNGWTAMGPGIQDAKTNKLNNASNARTMLVFTDGEQNIAPLVNGNGRDIGGVNINNPYPATPGSIKIFTIGIGNPSGTYLMTLQNLAAENRGQCLITSNGGSFKDGMGVLIGDINSVFVQTFANALRENSPQIVNERESKIDAGGASLLDFPLNDNVEDLVIEVRLSRKFERPQLESIIKNTIIMRDGTDVSNLFTPRFIGNFTDTYTLTTNFNKERVLSKIKSSSALWEVNLRGDNFTQGLTAYTTAIADDHLLDYKFQSSPKPSAGKDIKFTAKLAYNFKDFDKADIFAHVYRPGEDIGDILSKNPFKVEPNRDDKDKDKTSVGIMKYNALLNDRGFVKSLLPNEEVIPLKAIGNGVYEGVYSSTKVAGIYQVLYSIKGQSPTGGVIFRYEKESIYVRFADVDLAQSEVKILSQSASSMIFSFKPITKQGFLVGPAMADAFKFTTTDKLARLINVVDNQDGSYVLTFRGSPKSKGTLTLLDRKIYAGIIGKIK